MKKRIWTIGAMLLCSFILAACGETTMDNGRDTDGMAGEPPAQHESGNNSGDNTVNSVTDGAGNAVKDAVDGVGNAGKEVIDGAENVVNDAVNGVNNAVNNATGGNQ